MSSKKDNDKIFDSLLTEALNEVESEFNPNLPEEMDIEFSQEHKAKMKKLFDSEKKRLWYKQSFRLMQRITACFLVLIAISGVTVMSVKPLRISFLEFLSDSQQVNKSVTVNKETYETDKISLGYIPPGFEPEEEKVSDGITYLKFSNNSENITVSVYSGENAENIKPLADNCEQIIINGHHAVYSEENNEHILMMYSDNSIYIINSTINKEKIVEIAQNLKEK